MFPDGRAESYQKSTDDVIDVVVNWVVWERLKIIAQIVQDAKMKTGNCLLLLLLLLII